MIEKLMLPLKGILKGNDQNFSKNCNIEDLSLKILGDFGKWQLKISVLMCLLKLPLAWYQLNIIFMAPPQEYWCKKPDFLTMYTDSEWREICKPINEEHPCLIFDPEILLIAPNLDRSLITLVQCKHFVYDTTMFSRTITSDWNLVCSKHWLIHVTQVVMMAGLLVGTCLFGVLADQYGRKRLLMIGITMQCVASYLISVVPWYSLFLVNWFLLAIASGGIGIISFVLSMEVVGGKWRTIVPILYQLPFGLGNTIMACLAYWLRDWRKLEFALATLSAFYISYWFFLSESPRWMIACGKIDHKLEKVLKEAAAENKREKYYEKYRNEILKCIYDYNRMDPGFLFFIKSKNMCLKTLMLSINWFGTGLSFYTFSQYISYIGSNIFMTVALSGLISVLGSMFCLLIVTRAGRKMTVWLFQLITALCFVAIMFIPKDEFANDWPRLLLAGIGFACISGTIPALYLYSGEIFPTIGRNAGVGGVTTFARIASLVAPFIVSLEEIKSDLPVLLLAIISFSQLVLLVPLPETKNLPLFDNMEQIEEYFGRFGTGLSFYTFSQYISYIGSNIFMTVALSGLISVLGSMFCLLIVTRAGRKMTVWLFQLITALCFVAIMFIPKDKFANDWPRLLLAGIGFACISGTIPALYLYSGEIFPTIGRNAGVGGVTTFARIASLVAPFIVSLEEIKSDLPVLLLAIISFSQLVLLVPLPETKNLPLFDNMEQIEEYFGRENNSE